VTLGDISEFASRRRSLVSLAIEIGGLGVAATGLMWVGAINARIDRVEAQVARLEQSTRENHDAIVAVCGDRCVKK
jgi:hypothetical protein